MSEPTIIHGYASDSAGAAAFGPREEVAWKRHSGKIASFELVPLNGYYYTNGWAETLLRAKQVLPDELEAYDLDWELYFSRYAQEMAIDAEWRDISSDFNELCSTLVNFREEVRVSLLSSPSMVVLLDWLKRLVDAKLWERVRQDFRSNWLQGKEHGFSDIVECAAAATDLYHRQKRDLKLYNSLLPPK